MNHFEIMNISTDDIHTIYVVYVFHSVFGNSFGGFIKEHSQFPGGVGFDISATATILADRKHLLQTPAPDVT